MISVKCQKFTKPHVLSLKPVYFLIQQICKCGSQYCRGILGGRKQWGNVGPSKHGDKLQGKKCKLSKDKRKSKHKLDRDKVLVS